MKTREKERKRKEKKKEKKEKKEMLASPAETMDNNNPTLMYDS